MRKTLFLLSGLILPLFYANAENINFADSRVKSLCISQWDDNHDGELSMEEAADVTSLGALFGGSDITSFDELQYFTGLTKINPQEFYNCTSLKSIILPSQVTSIGGSAFYGCTALTSIDIPAAVTKIDSYAFTGCIYLANMTLHEGVTTIDNYAFSTCKSLTSLSIPASLTSISASAFRSCIAINSITVAAGNTKYDSREDCNAIIESSTNTLFIGSAATVVPASVTAIGENAFYGNTSLASIVIPEGVKTIGISAFSGCTSLTSIELPSTLTTIGQDAFSGCTKLSRAILSEGLTTISNTAFKGCKALTRIRIPSTVTAIDAQAFYQCTGLVKVAVDFNTPISIKNNVFSNRTRATLYVPTGYVEDFQTANIWNEFNTVVEQKRTISATVDPETMAPDSETTIKVSLANDDYYAFGSLGMTLTFPEGFTPNASKLVLSDRCAGMQASLEALEGNAYRLTCSSSDATVTGSEGILFTLGMNAASDVAAGNYEATITNITLGTDDNCNVKADDATATWAVNNFILGDVDHDGFVNIYDVTMMIDYILAFNPQNFHFREADLDHDGFVNIYDVTMVIDILLNRD